jgi:cyclopropane fatty-acyl-phospholipid synthase-like methyltransferase
MTRTADPFFEPYDREDIAYGDQPSAALAAYLQQIGGSGEALDLGAGAGRDTIALAAAGYRVTAVDLSLRGLSRIRQRAADAGLSQLVETCAADVREVEMPQLKFSAIVATTVLDHLPPADAEVVWQKMTAAVSDRGFLYVQVHTTEDPGSDREPGVSRDAPISETAAAVINYFSPNQLAVWAADPESGLRILRYEERLEWDYTHGPEHLHGKAVLLAVREGYYPDWYGQPAAFPRQPS